MGITARAIVESDSGGILWVVEPAGSAAEGALGEKEGRNDNESVTFVL